MSSLGAMKLDCVWVRARRLKPAIRYYSALFGWPVIQELYDGELYVFHMTDGRKLLLDDIRQTNVNDPLARPTSVLVTQDLKEVHDRSKQVDFAHVSNIERGVHYSYFVCRDRDHNEFVVAEHPFDYPGTESIPRVGPIETLLSGVTIPVNDVRKEIVFFTDWLGQAPQYVSEQNAECPRVLLLDGAYIELVPKIEGVIHSSPLLRLQSPDLPAAYRHLKAIGANLDTKREEAEKCGPIHFSDPDGYPLAVEFGPSPDRYQSCR